MPRCSSMCDARNANPNCVRTVSCPPRTLRATPSFRGHFKAQRVSAREENQFPSVFPPSRGTAILHERSGRRSLGPLRENLRPIRPARGRRRGHRRFICAWKTGTLGLEAPPGFEPGMEVLQTSALPLGYRAFGAIHLSYIRQNETSNLCVYSSTEQDHEYPRFHQKAVYRCHSLD